jgi:hypothetical protein
MRIGLLALILAITLVFAVRAQEAESRTPGGGASVYRYKGATGRTVYTNVEEQVPLEQRPTARVDLERVSLNTEVGNELSRRLQAEHAALIQTPYCTQLRQAADTSFIARLWAEFAPLVVTALALLLLLAISPIALRRFGAEAWSKALSMAIPTAFAMGLLVFSIEKTHNSMQAVKTKARACTEQSFAALSGRPDANVEHARLVAELKREIANSGVGNLVQDIR